MNITNKIITERTLVLLKKSIVTSSAETAVVSSIDNDISNCLKFSLRCEADCYWNLVDENVAVHWCGIAISRSLNTKIVTSIMGLCTI